MFSYDDFLLPNLANKAKCEFVDIFTYIVYGNIFHSESYTFLIVFFNFSMQELIITTIGTTIAKLEGNENNMQYRIGDNDLHDI